MNRYLQADLEAFDIRELKSKFDVILLEPPLEEYYRETGITANEKCWTWDDVSTFSCEEHFMHLFMQIVSEFHVANTTSCSL